MPAAAIDGDLRTAWRSAPGGTGPDVLWRRFCSAIGIPSDLVDVASTPRHNESLGVAQIAVMRHVLAGLEEIGEAEDNRLEQPWYSVVAKRWFAQTVLSTARSGKPQAPAAVGDRLAVIAPRRGQFYGGIEFDPGTARRLLLVGDETAVPAICAILGQLRHDAVGAAFLEVPSAADVLTVEHPEGVEVVWLARDEDTHGARLHQAVLDHLGVGGVTIEEPDEVDPDLWETPSYSSSGEAVATPGTGAGGPDGRYAWIAGESAVVTGLRRHLVRGLGMDRGQVAFMGYWRRGVAMRA